MTEDEPQANRLESLVLTLIFAAISVVLLVLIGAATKSGPASAGWWTRPMLAPGVALILLSGANLMTLWRALSDLRRTPATADEKTEARQKMLGWLLPLEFLGYFAVYVWALHMIGYLLATLAFIQWVLFRVGMRSTKWRVSGVLAAIAMMLIFRVGLGVWMPSPALFELFPNAMRMALIRWF